jgi:hypothetical protein
MAHHLGSFDEVPFATPTGGGHWILVIGWDPGKRQFLIHDPNGDTDHVSDRYVSTAIDSGHAQRCPYRN